MSWLTKRLRGDEPGVFAFGKVPAFAEFVRAGLNDETSNELQGWMGKAVDWAANHRAEPWERARRNGPMLRFVLRSRNPNTVMTGVVQASHDAMGRAFPLSVAAVVPAKGAGAVSHLAPATFRPFLDEGSSLLSRIAAIQSVKEVEGLLAGLHVPSLDEVAPEQERYEAWSRQSAVGGVLEAAFAGWQADGEAALHTILEATTPFRGQEAPPTALSIRLPVDRSQPLLLCFWLEVIRIACSWRETVPGYFASEKDVLVQLGGLASPSVLADSWAPDDGSKYVCHPAGDTSLFATPFPDELRELLTAPDATVDAFLRTLSETVRR